MAKRKASPTFKQARGVPAFFSLPKEREAAATVSTGCSQMAGRCPAHSVGVRLVGSASSTLCVLLAPACSSVSWADLVATLRWCANLPK